MAKLGDLAKRVGGMLEGDPDLEISSVGPIDTAGDGEIAFIANRKYFKFIETSKASAIILPPGVEATGKSRIITKNPYLAFAKILTILAVHPAEPLGIMPGSNISESADVAQSATVYSGCFIGDNVRVGKRTVLYPNVTLYSGVQIGDDCIVHAGVVVREGCEIGNRVVLQPAAVIGSDGFGFAPDGESYFKIPQVGIVVLEDDVEVGASTCIDRATLGITRIKKGTKIDNLVQIGHNVTVGENTVLVSQVAIAGSSEIGNHCTLGGQVGIAGHLKICDNVMIGAKSGISGDIRQPNQVLSGVPAFHHKDWLKASMSFQKLPEMRKEIAQLKKRISDFENLLTGQETD